MPLTCILFSISQGELNHWSLCKGCFAKLLKFQSQSLQLLEKSYSCWFNNLACSTLLWQPILVAQAIKWRNSMRTKLTKCSQILNKRAIFGVWSANAEVKSERILDGLLHPGKVKSQGNLDCPGRLWSVFWQKSTVNSRKMLKGIWYVDLRTFSLAFVRQNVKDLITVWHYQTEKTRSDLL